MLRTAWAAMLLATVVHLTANAQEDAEAPEKPASQYSGMTDDELVDYFLAPRAGMDSSQRHPRTGLPMNMDALNELFQRHPEWNWDMILTWKVALGMGGNEVKVAWGKPRKINEREEGDVWSYRTKFPPSGHYLEFSPEGQLARIKD